MCRTHRASRRNGWLIFLIQVSRPIVWPVLPLVYYLGLHAAHAELSRRRDRADGAAHVSDESHRLRAERHLRLRIRPPLAAAAGDLGRGRSRRGPAARVAGVPGDDAARWCSARASRGIGTTSSPRSALLLVAWCYSVPPVRLKERPPLDSLANGLGYFLLPFVMGYSLGADPRGNAAEVLSARAVGVRRPCAGDRRRLRGRPGGRPSHDGRRVWPARGAAIAAFATFFVDVALGRFREHGRARVHRHLHARDVGRSAQSRKSA